MHAKASKRIARKLAVLLSVAVLAACGTGDGPQRIENEPATPIPPTPPGFCDPINFEIVCPPVEINNFNGGATTVIPNPDASGINTSDSVAQMQKYPDDPALLFGGTSLVRGPALDFANGTAFKIKLWSPRDVRLLFKLEAGRPVDQGASRELEQTIAGNSTWEEYCYDFAASLPTLDVFGIVLIFDNGVRGAADTDPANWTFFYDDIEQVESCGGGGPPALPDLPVDFEGGSDSWFGDFDGGVASVIANPDPSGINPSAEVAQMQKFAGEVYGGSTLGLANPVDFGNGDVFTVKVWASRQVPVLFKLEGLNQELEINHTGSGAWEELCFDFTGLTAGPAATAITFIFDNGTAGDAGNTPNDWTFYFDDITQVADCGGGGIPPAGIIPEVVIYATDPAVPVDLVFGVDYAGFEPFGSGSSFDNNVMTDADFNPAFGVTTGNGYGAQVGQFAIVGFAAGYATGYQTLDFKAKGLNNDLIRVKFLDAGDYIDVTLTTSGYSTDLGNGWYQVSIPLADFTGVDTATGLLFETDNTAANAFQFLLTDFGFSGTAGGGGAGLVTNGDFEAGNLDDWEVFDNGGTITLSAPGSGGAGSAVNLNIDVAGNPTLKQTGIGVGTLTPNQTFAISFDWKGTAANGGVIDFQVFSEQAGGGVTKADLVQGGDGFPADWTTVGPLNYTTAADISGGLTVQITAICGAVAGCVSDLFIDNIVVTIP